jgi:hypothetical protein
MIAFVFALPCRCLVFLLPCLVVVCGSLRLVGLVLYLYVVLKILSVVPTQSITSSIYILRLLFIVLW